MRQFTFLSELQRMSVLVRKSLCDDAKQTEVYVKGSPEKIHQLCIPESSMLHMPHVSSCLQVCSP